MEFLHPAMWHCGSGIVTVNSPSGSTAMWYVALRWHAVEFTQKSAVLEFYIWFRFRPHHRSRHVILHQSGLRNFIQIGPSSAEKKTSCRFSRWRISAILDFRDPIMGSLKSRCTTSYRSSIETIALNCLVFFVEKIAFFAFWRQTDKQTNRRTDGQHRCIKPLSLSRAGA